jgi:hypothetical protein
MLIRKLCLAKLPADGGFRSRQDGKKPVVRTPNRATRYGRPTQKRRKITTHPAPRTKCAVGIRPGGVCLFQGIEDFLADQSVCAVKVERIATGLGETDWTLCPVHE